MENNARVSSGWGSWPFVVGGAKEVAIFRSIVVCFGRFDWVSGKLGLEVDCWGGGVGGGVGGGSRDVDWREQ